MYVGAKVQASRRIPRITDVTSFPPSQPGQYEDEKNPYQTAYTEHDRERWSLGIARLFPIVWIRHQGVIFLVGNDDHVLQTRLIVDGWDPRVIGLLPRCPTVAVLYTRTSMQTQTQERCIHPRSTQQGERRERETDGPRWRMTVIKSTDSLTIAPLEWTARSLRWDSLGRHLPPRYEIPSNLDVFSLIIHPHLQCPTVTPRLAVR